MSLEGKATARSVLRGKISSLVTYVTDAYAIAVQNGFEGTEAEWLESLRGADGISPVVSVEIIEGGHRVTITDREGSHIYDVYDGVDGVSPVVRVEDIDGGHRVTVTDKDGEKTYDVIDGKDGVNVSIIKITESAEDDGFSTIEFSNGSILKIKNGSKGSTGAAGKDGVNGKDGIDGVDGKNGTSISVVSVSESTEDGGSNVVTFSDGSTLTVKNGKAGAGASITVDSELSATSENPVQNKVITTEFNAALANIEQAITVLYTAMSSALATPASVDMSGFDSGTIVETFADGTTKTTTIEFDANGNPVKIRDGDGRVTTYTW